MRGEPMFKVEVIADTAGNWTGNALTFDTVEKAKQYADNLFMRWTAVREWRVIEETPEGQVEVARG